MAWYWQAWRKRLWKTHLLIFLVVFWATMASLYAGDRGKLSLTSFLLALAFGLLSILWMLIYPQLRYKPQVRDLEVDQDGISTTIGRLAGRRSWDEVLSISEEDDQIVILGRNGNAFLVPARAFISIEEKKAFLSFVQSALQPLESEHKSKYAPAIHFRFWHFSDMAAQSLHVRCAGPRRKIQARSGYFAF